MIFIIHGTIETPIQVGQGEAPKNWNRDKALKNYYDAENIGDL